MEELDERELGSGDLGSPIKREGTNSGGLTSPPLYSIHKGTVRQLKPFGAFVSIPGYDRDGLLHISKLSSERVEKIEDVISLGDYVWCKVVEIDAGPPEKYSLDIRYVSQRDGRDMDQNNIHIGEHKKSGGPGGGVKREKIELGAVLKTTCTRCGGSGHLPFECFARMQGTEVKHYDLIEDTDDTEGEKGKSVLDSFAGKTVLESFASPTEKRAPMFATGGNMEPLKVQRHFNVPQTSVFIPGTMESSRVNKKEKRKDKEKRKRRDASSESSDEHVSSRKRSHKTKKRRKKSNKHHSSDSDSDTDRRASHRERRDKKQHHGSEKEKHRHHSDSDSSCSDSHRHKKDHHKKDHSSKKHKKSKRGRKKEREPHSSSSSES
eukprot:Selendium_serpulae@DN5084_c0_g1_i4.p1